MHEGMHHSALHIVQMLEWQQIAEDKPCLHSAIQVPAKRTSQLTDKHGNAAGRLKRDVLVDGDRPSLVVDRHLAKHRRLKQIGSWICS